MLAQQTHQPRVRLPTSTSVAKRFGSYAPETDQRVRLPQPTGIPDLERLRKLREELKQMPPEVVLEMMKFHNNLNMSQALELAKRTGKLLVPNIVHDRLHKRTDVHYFAWTGTMIIYEAPKKPFGFEVNSNGLVFTVPEQFIGKKNCALVVEHPDFDIVDKGNGKYELVVPDLDMLHLVENFPKAKGWYPHTGNQFGIPQESPKFFLRVLQRIMGRKSEKNRYLWHTASGYIGLLARIIDEPSKSSRDVVACWSFDGDTIKLATFLVG